MNTRIPIRAAVSWLALFVMLSILAVSVFFAAKNTATSPLHISVDVDFSKKRFNGVLLNTTSKSIGVWDFSNSWGETNLIVDLRDVVTGDVHLVLPKTLDWTAGGGGYHILASGAKERIPIDITDGRWQIPVEVDLTNKIYWVRLRMLSPSSEETTQLNIFAGELSSSWKCCFAAPLKK